MQRQPLYINHKYTKDKMARDSNQSKIFIHIPNKYLYIIPFMYFQSAKAIRILIDIRKCEFTVEDDLQNLLKLNLPSLFVELLSLQKYLISI